MEISYLILFGFVVPGTIYEPCDLYPFSMKRSDENVQWDGSVTELSETV